MKKVILVVSLLSFVLLFIVIYQKIRFEDGKTHIIFCNVGQGDGILIRSPKGTDIIEDGGPDDSILSCISRHTPFWDRQIELMMLSHPHEDHMMGLTAILKEYKTLAFATENLHNTTALYNKLAQLLKEKNVAQRLVYAGDSFVLSDGLKLKILGPTREFVSKTPNGEIRESKEDGSLATLISYGSFDAILTGDAPLMEIEDFLTPSLPKIAVFEIPHHGSRFNIDEKSLLRLSPSLAVISVGRNKYGHPAPEVIKILGDSDIKYLRTDKHGDVEITVDKNGKFIVN